MSPESEIRGDATVEIFHAIADTSLGLVLMAATVDGVCWVALGDEPALLEADLRREFPLARLTPVPQTGSAWFRAWLADVVAVVAGRPTLHLPPLIPQGTSFQRQVWDALREIPVGETRTYTQLAAIVGRSTAARAVALACATNPIAVLIPCHRIIRSDGGIAGYRWGLVRKTQLLAREHTT